MIERTKQHGLLYRICTYALLTFFVVLLFAVVFSYVVGPNVGFLLRQPYSVLAYPRAYNIDNDMRKLGLIMADGCEEDQDCVIVNIYKNLSQELTYSHTPYGKYMDKWTVWDQKSGDCKSLSGLYVNLLINRGVMAFIAVSINGKHAVAVAEPKGEDYYYMIDLTVPTIERYNKGVNFWKFYHFE